MYAVVNRATTFLLLHRLMRLVVQVERTEFSNNLSKTACRKSISEYSLKIQRVLSNMSDRANFTVPNLFNFSNHVVLVAGGATGLGEMAAQGFVQNGAKVIIASRKRSRIGEDGRPTCPGTTSV
jgi:3-oxoacyl-ACP reductase-like protein